MATMAHTTADCASLSKGCEGSVKRPGPDATRDHLAGALHWHAPENRSWLNVGNPGRTGAPIFDPPRVRVFQAHPAILTSIDPEDPTTEVQSRGRSALAVRRERRRQGSAAPLIPSRSSRPSTVQKTVEGFRRIRLSKAGQGGTQRDQSGRTRDSELVDVRPSPYLCV